MAERRAEVLFARTLQAVHAALRDGRKQETEAALLQAQKLAQGQPWLEAKLVHLRKMVARDSEMAAKEVRYSAKRMNVRLSAPMPVAYGTDETDNLEIPAFLRRKVGEGLGKK